jgi:energy-coupling factor transporter ATP-binding protein EcfA2
MKALERQSVLLKAKGRLESLKTELALLKSRLDEAPLWQPGAGLGGQCLEAAAMIDGIAARMERSLVVVVIGPSGSGKSTLVNALAGGQTLSPTGRDRPTTGHLIVFGAAGDDGVELTRELGGESVEMRAAAGRALPERVCLIDTPDTDSMALQRHIPALERAVAHADVLICVFDAENPKRRDHADFLAPIIRRFDGQSLVAVLNKCDRLDAAELRERILPDFIAYIQAAWQGAVDRALCISARRHITEPAWDAAAGPRHEFDQFDELQSIVFGAMGQGRFTVDRRLENARRLHEVVLDDARRELAADRDVLQAAGRRFSEIEKAAMVKAAESLRSGDPRLFSGGVGASAYQKLSQRWVGPVGWLLAVWTRLMVIGSGIASLLRIGRPGSGLFGVLRAPSAGKGAGAASRAPAALEAVMHGYRLALLKGWPEVAELLARGRFDVSVRRLDAAGAVADRFAAEVAGLWAEAVEEEVSRVVRRLSGFWLQLVINAPTVGVLCYVGWLTVLNFFNSRYLGGDFFVHALWVIAIVAMLSFFLLQVLIRLAAGPERIAGRAFEHLHQDLQQFDMRSDFPVRVQLETILDLMQAATGS